MGNSLDRKWDCRVCLSKKLKGQKCTICNTQRWCSQEGRQTSNKVTKVQIGLGNKRKEQRLRESRERGKRVGRNYYKDIEKKSETWKHMIPSHYELSLLLKAHLLNEGLVSMNDNDNEDGNGTSEREEDEDDEEEEEERKRTRGEMVGIDFIALNIALFCYESNEPMQINIKKILYQITVHQWQLPMEHYILDVIATFVGGIFYFLFFIFF
ncbi:hypothetical protein RFI_17574 [Reticulomyxa filosa]|uniref:Uncharacterized protein n=1 Tax=Reticulomyxa filosa TaxID=46433 RepID=X6N0Q1_RETFI|nr:hypothetical protein RFI_17574 [Reticulomyxa filosa]|eukprot:ETO19656.1 hypothetical protein RFI_17574 [Reticulomyxa filosa]